MPDTTALPLPRIERLCVRNFRTQYRGEVRDISPLTILSATRPDAMTLDGLAFLGECFELGLKRAWAARGRTKELKPFGSSGPLTVELKYREKGYPVITYRLALDAPGDVPIVVEERMMWRTAERGAPFNMLSFKAGFGQAYIGDRPDEWDQSLTIRLTSPDLLAVNALGQFIIHPRISALRDYIAQWHADYRAALSARDSLTAVLLFVEEHGGQSERIAADVQKAL